MKYFPQFILKNFNSIGKFKEYYSVLQLDSSAELIILALYKYISFFSPESFESELYTVWYFESEVTQSCPTLCDPWTVVGQAPPSWDFPGENTGLGCHFLLQGIFLTQESNPDLLHYRQTLYRLSHQGILYGTLLLNNSGCISKKWQRSHESQTMIEMVQFNYLLF